jgi:hypothetical protein
MTEKEAKFFGLGILSSGTWSSLDIIKDPS